MLFCHPGRGCFARGRSVLIPTTKQTRLEWLTERMKGLGGSDMPAVWGLPRMETELFPYTSRMDVYFSKVEPPKLDTPKPQARMGTESETCLILDHGRKNGLSVAHYPWTRITDGREWEHGNIDGLAIKSGALYDPSGKILTNTGIEAKTTMRACRNHWGEPGTDEIAEYYFAQVYWYMAVFPEIEVFEVPVCFWSYDMTVEEMQKLLDYHDEFPDAGTFSNPATLFRGCERVHYIVERDDEAVQMVRDVGEEFWKKYVIPKTPPPPESSRDLLLLYSSDTSTSITATARMVEVCRTKKAKDEAYKEADLAKKKADEAVKMELGQAEGATIGGDPLVTYKAQDVTRIDSKRLRDEKPEIFEEYSNTKTERKLLLKTKNL